MDKEYRLRDRRIMLRFQRGTLYQNKLHVSMKAWKAHTFTKVLTNSAILSLRDGGIVSSQKVISYIVSQIKPG